MSKRSRRIPPEAFGEIAETPGDDRLFEVLFITPSQLLQNPESRLREIERMHQAVDEGRLSIKSANARLAEFDLPPLSEWPRLPPEFNICDGEG